MKAPARAAMPGATKERAAGFVFLTITVLGWAINWPTVKILLQAWPPLFSRGLAGVCAALGLMLIAAIQRHRLLPPRAAVPVLLLAAFTNVFAWMGFATVALKWLSVAEAALLCYTMPIWVVLLAWPIRHVRPTRRGVIALALGFAGVVVLLGVQQFSLAGEQGLGAGLVLAAAVCFAFGTVINAQPPALAPVVWTAWQVGLGCLPMLAIGIFFEPPLAALSTAQLASFVYMTIVPMGVCYLAWFAALRRLPASEAAMGMLFVPVMGIISAALMIGESIGLREIVAMTLTLTGVALAVRRD